MVNFINVIEDGVVVGRYLLRGSKEVNYRGLNERLAEIERLDLVYTGGRACTS